MLCVATLALLLQTVRALAPFPEPGVLPSGYGSRIDGMEHGLWQLSKDQILKTIEAKARTRVRPPPDIVALEPPVGLSTGGTEVTITGDFLGVRPKDLLSVQIGGLPCLKVKWIATSEIVCTVPSFGSEGMVNATVTTRSGGLGMLGKAFKYEAPPTPIGHADGLNKTLPLSKTKKTEPELLPQRPNVTKSTLGSLNVSWTPYPNAVFYKLMMDADNYTLPLNTWHRDATAFFTVVDNLATNSTYKFKIEVTYATESGSLQHIRSEPSEFASTLAPEILSDMTTHCTADRTYAGQSDMSYNRGQLLAPDKSGRLLSLSIPVCVEQAGPSGVTIEIAIFEMDAKQPIISFVRTLYEQPHETAGPQAGASRCPAAAEEIVLKLPQPPKLRADRKYLIAMRRKPDSGRDKCVELDGQLVVDPSRFCEGQTPLSKCDEYPMLAARRCYVRARLFWLSNSHYRGGTFSSKEWPPVTGEAKYGFCNSFNAVMRKESLEIVEEPPRVPALEVAPVAKPLVETSCHPKELSEEEYLGDAAVASAAVPTLS